jgi:protein-L-isoaspartate O-methyltransferase
MMIFEFFPTYRGNARKTRVSLLSRGASIVIITPYIDQLLADRMLQLKESKFDVIIVYVIVDNPNNELLEVVSKSGIKLYKIRMNDDVRALLEG